MDFIDFELRAWMSEPGQVHVIVHSSPVGDMSRPISVTCDIDRLKDFQQGFTKFFWYDNAEARKHLIDMGRVLSEVLLPTQVYSLLTRSLEHVNPDFGLRIRLCLDEHLLDMPWEYMYSPDAPDESWLDGFLVLNPLISMVRGAPRRVRNPKVLGRRRMVFAGAFWSGDKDEWHTREEYKELSAALKPVEQFLATEFINAAGEQIETALIRPASIFHYAGHVDQKDDYGYLVQEVYEGDDRQVHFDRLYSEDIANMLKKAGVQLAVFSACNSGQRSFVEPLLRAGLPALVGLQGSTSNESAIEFFQRLYYCLAIGLSLDEGVIWARQALREANVSHKDSLEWGSFMVYMPSTDPFFFPRRGQKTVLMPQDVQGASTKDDKRKGNSRDNRKHVDTSKLREIIVQRYNIDDLKLLCADVQNTLESHNVNELLSLDAVAGDNLPTKVHGVIDFLQRRDCLGYLFECIKEKRPDVDKALQALRGLHIETPTP